MRAIVASRPGGPEVLEIIETAEPEVRRGEVKIRVRAFGLNKAESYYRSGNYGIFRSDLALGYEAVGEVVEDSNGVLAVGQSFGGGGRESNPPETLRPLTGFEDPFRPYSLSFDFSR